MHTSRREFLINASVAATLGAAASRARAAEQAADPPSQADERLNDLFDRLFERVLEISPQLVVTQGRDSGANSQARMHLDDETPEGQARRKQLASNLLAELRAFDQSGLSLRGRLDYESVLFTTRAEALAREHFYFGRVDRRISPYVVSHLAGSYLDASEYISNKRPPADGSELEVYVTRLRDFSRNLDGENERIRRDVAAGITPPDFILERTLARMRVQQDKLAGHGLGPELRDPQSTAQTILDREVLPRLADQAALLQSLRGSTSNAAGISPLAALSRLKNYQECYSAALRVGTTTEPSVYEFRREALAELHDLDAQADRLLKKIGLGRGAVHERLRKLASDDRYLYPDSDSGKDRAVAQMNARLLAIVPALKPLFQTPINTNLEVRRLTRDEELAGRAGYRVGPSADGARPGIYFVDLHAIRDRPSWSLPSVTYHETAPGHLVQLPRQEAAKLHPLRQQLNPRGYVEGWAIYAETLAAQIGVYHDDPLGEIGYLQSRLFRVARLLVDIGIHVSGWNREQAIATLTQMTAQPRALCETDVDRYFVLPGMIAGDEIGYYGWRAARNRAHRNAGSKFDLAAFHDESLNFGPFPQTLLAHRLFST
jgi:uncharacterized protein (DUF885 family)